jgi:hypothetical protein
MFTLMIDLLCLTPLLAMFSLMINLLCLTPLPAMDTPGNPGYSGRVEYKAVQSKTT